MRIALMNPVFWPEVRRGSERVIRDLADGLLAQGHHVRLITSHRGRPSLTVEDGLEVERVWRPPVAARLDRRMYEQHLAHLPFALRALDRFAPDLAHAFYATDAVAALRWGKGPVVFSYMGVPHRQGLANRRLRKELLLKACAGATVTALSAEAVAAFDHWLGVEARAIAPGVDLDTFTPDPAARASAPTILCAADPGEPRKRVPLLAEAFGRLRTTHADARLVLSHRPGTPTPQGPGIEGRDLDTRAALIHANREAWVHALPSFGEAFGLVLAEALACGTTPLGPTRVLVDGVGEHFEGGDPTELAQALARALEKSGNAAACRARAEQFSRQATTDAYAALYAELAS